LTYVTPDDVDHRNLLDAVNEGVGISDADHRFTWVNTRLADMLGYHREELIGKTPLDLVVEEDRERFLEQGARRGEGERQPYELTLVRRDGTRVPVLVSPRPRFEPDGRFLGTVSVITDITVLKRAEEAIRRSEATSRALLDATTDDAYLVDTDGVVIACNEPAARSLGVRREELLGSNVLDLFAPEVRKRRRAAMDEAVASRRPYEFEDEREGRIHHAVLYPVAGDRGIDRLAVYTRDVTDARRLEKEVRRAHKLEALGVMAGGIAHDFNNLLTAIIGNQSLARMAVEAGEDTSEPFREAAEASERARELALQLLTFSRGGDPVRRPTDVSVILLGASRYLPEGSRATCICDVPDDIWSAHADARQIGQVIEQLVVNADQAMPRGGTITLAVSNVEVVPGDGDPPRHVEPGRYVRITVADEGVGIHEKNRDRVFDPFFSTRGKGSGLGLSIAHAIVRKHGGAIHLDPAGGAGTRFTILLPATSAAPVEREAPGRAPGKAKGRVLVMDDEAIVRRFLTKVLTMSGHEVVTTSDGREAVEAYRRALDEGVPFDGVIMDLTVPGGMGGEEAIGLLLDVDAHARVVVSSGYSDSPVMARFRGYGFIGVLPKPYDIDEVDRVIRKLLVG
jgi:PAS domain S-box-containing protein